MSQEPSQDRQTSPSDDERRAVDAALAFLAYRPRTRQEISRKLEGRGFGAPVIEAALARLDQVGLINDFAFIETYVRHRIVHRPMGIRRMAQELHLKGISREVTVPVIERVLGEENVGERSLAERAAARRVSLLLEAGDRSTARRRLNRYLARRGFDPEVIREIVDDQLPSR